jgi:hypothetical protein
VLITTANMGSRMLLTPTTPFKLQISSSCTTRTSCDVPSTIKTMALLMTFTSSRQLTLRQQAREQSIIFQRSHDISGRPDTPRTSSQLSRSTTVALTQVYGSKCTTLQHAPLAATKITWQDTPLVMGKAPLLWLDNLPTECITS